MARNVKLLKILVIVFWFIFALSFALSLLEDPSAAEAADRLGMKFVGESVLAVLTLITLIVTILATIGLYRLKGYARPLFLVANALLLLILLTMGYTVDNPLLATLNAISGLISGAIILLIYLDDSKGLFENEFQDGK